MKETECAHPLTYICHENWGEIDICLRHIMGCFVNTKMVDEKWANKFPCRYIIIKRKITLMANISPNCV